MRILPLNRPRLLLLPSVQLEKDWPAAQLCCCPANIRPPTCPPCWVLAVSPARFRSRRRYPSSAFRSTSRLFPACHHCLRGNWTPQLRWRQGPTRTPRQPDLQSAKTTAAWKQLAFCAPISDTPHP